jgi:hypothetical protein
MACAVSNLLSAESGRRGPGRLGAGHVQGRDQPAEGCSEREDPVVESFEALFDRYEQKIFNLIYRFVILFIHFSSDLHG